MGTSQARLSSKGGWQTKGPSKPDRTARGEQVQEAKLQDKNKGMMQETAGDIIELFARAVDENNAEKRARIESGEMLTNAQKTKAVLITYRNVNNINVETVLSRHRDL